MSDGLRERLIAATAKWRKLDSERDAARNEVLDAATALLQAGALPPEVVALTPFSDALVRAETRKRGAPKGKRGPKRNEESKPVSDAPGAIVQPTTAPRAPAMTSREEELHAYARDLAEDAVVEVVDRIVARHPVPYLRGKTPREKLGQAIQAGMVTVADLRNV